jgi:hypothetical protein
MLEIEYLYGALAYIAFALSPITRQERVARLAGSSDLQCATGAPRPGIRGGGQNAGKVGAHYDDGEELGLLLKRMIRYALRDNRPFDEKDLELEP